MKEEILDFIDQFKAFDKTGEVTDTFTMNMCYWFAVILNQRFNGELVYNPKENHFASCINGFAFDITGRISNRDFVRWTDFVKEEPYEAERIVRDCIKKERVT